MAPGRSAALYTALAAVFSAPLWVLVARRGVHDTPAVLALMYCPAAAAFVAAWVTRRPVAAFGWHWPAFRFMAAGYAIPVAYAAAAYGVVWALGLGRPDTVHYAAMTHHDFWHGLPLLAVVGVFGGCIAALGEEIGWRGFLVPVLASKYGFAATALISGAIWTAWHVPIIVFGDYNGGTPAWYGVTCFAACVLGVGFLFAWLRMASGSVWPCVMLHAVHNTYVQEVFTPLTASTGHTAWFIDEFGAVLPVAIIVAAILAIRYFPLPGWRLPEFGVA
jgi:membrane protease YdiL (CAAX protease family)